MRVFFCFGMSICELNGKSTPALTSSHGCDLEQQDRVMVRNLDEGSWVLPGTPYKCGLPL